MNNKLLLVALAFLVVSILVHCDEDNSDEILKHVKSKRLEKILKSYKQKYIGHDGMSELEEKCPGVTHKLKDAIIAFGEYDDAIDDSLTLCTAVRIHALNCTRPILKVIDDCLPQKAKGLPDLGVKSLISAADYLCKLDGESLFELFNPCLWESYLGPPPYTVEMSKCEKRFSDKFNEYKKDIPTVQNVCSLATDFRTCAKENNEISCKNEKTKTVALGLYDALIHPCSTLVNN